MVYTWWVKADAYTDGGYIPCDVGKGKGAAVGSDAREEVSSKCTARHMARADVLLVRTLRYFFLDLKLISCLAVKGPGVVCCNRWTLRVFGVPLLGHYIKISVEQSMCICA